MSAATPVTMRPAATWAAARGRWHPVALSSTCVGLALSSHPVNSDPRTAVVLVNLGTPDAPTARAVRRYLAEFLHDHRVVDLTRWLWCPLLHFVILPLRGPKVARKYASVWIEGERGGSPLLVHTRDLAEGLQRELPDAQVLHAMRYGTPSLRDALARLREAGIERTVVVPLYPQYSSSTTASIEDVVDQAAKDSQAMAMHVVRDYHLDPMWVRAVADSITAHRTNVGSDGHLLFSFHGLPQRFVDRGDPYAGQCELGARAVVQALGLDDSQWTMSFQSRFGREKWLQPSTEDTLGVLQARGIQAIDVIAPGFAVDCLETLEEVSMELAEQVHERGGTLRYIPCLNATDAHARVMAGVVTRALEHADAQAR